MTTTSDLDLDPAEQARLEALAGLGLSDGPLDPALEAIVRVAAAVVGLPHATLNVIDAHRQCQLATVGFEGIESAREDSMCATHFLDGRVVHVADASTSETYRGNPWVDGRLGAVRSYASAPLVTSRGLAVGSLCVFDTAPRQLDPEQLARLEDLASVVVSLVEQRSRTRRHADLQAEAERQRALALAAVEQLEAHAELTDAVLDSIDVGVIASGPTGRVTLFNRTALDWHGQSADPTLDPTQQSQRYGLFEADGATPMPADRVPLQRALSEGSVTDAEVVLAPPSRPARRLLVSGRAMTRADGTLLGAVIAQRDVTADRDQRRTLQELHGALADRTGLLEQEVATRRRAQQQLRKANDELQRAVLRDGLTGLFNRPALDARLEREWHHHTVDHTPLSVLMIDVDHFKKYNDTAGHLAGDECLRAVAACLRETAVRPSDLVARYGGEEFAVVLADTTSQGAQATAERLLQRVRAAALPHPGLGAGAAVSVSIGIATAAGEGDRAIGAPGSVTDLKELMAAADRALYAAKHAGRDTSRTAG